MGHKVSREKVHVVVSLRDGLCRLDTMTVSYRGSGCLGRRRQVASFTFPGKGWRCYGGVAACKAQGGLCVPLADLKKKDPARTVQLRCSKGSKILLKAAMTLGEFINSLDFLHFSLRSEAKDSSGQYTSIRCNGRRCDDAEQPPTWPQSNGMKEPSAPHGASTTSASNDNVTTKVVTTTGDDGTVTKVATTPANDDNVTTKAETTAGGGGAVTKAATAPANDGNVTTKAVTTAGGGGAVTKAATTPADNDNPITKAVTTAGDGSTANKDATTPVRHSNDITKATNTKAGDVSAPIPELVDKVDGVDEAAMEMTHGRKCKVSVEREQSGAASHTTLRRRKTMRPTQSAHGSAAVKPNTPAGPCNFADAFLEVTAISVFVVSIAMTYYWFW